jgi:hypothetical protein
MKKLIVASALALAVMTHVPASADIYPDLLHGFCYGCPFGSGNTQIAVNSNGTLGAFGFNTSQVSTGELVIDFLIPTNVSFSGLNFYLNLYLNANGRSAETRLVAAAPRGLSAALRAARRPP